MDYFQFVYPIQNLFLGLLAGFIILRLRELPKTKLLTTLIILTTLSALGCFGHCLCDLWVLLGGLRENNLTSPSRLLLVVAMVLSPFATTFILTGLTVLVCHRSNGSGKTVLTPEARYGTDRTTNPSGRG